jgi:hypothetical protein
MRLFFLVPGFATTPWHYRCFLHSNRLQNPPSEHSRRRHFSLFGLTKFRFADRAAACAANLNVDLMT